MKGEKDLLAMGNNMEFEGTEHRKKKFRRYFVRFDAYLNLKTCVFCLI